MRRREFIAALSGAAAWQVTARAQQVSRMPHVMIWLGGIATDPDGQRNALAFRDGMRALGWIDGRNVRIEERWIASSFTADETNASALEIVKLNPDAVVTTGAAILGALHRQSKSIPIVFTMVTDPVRDGFVASLARPGGNITGFTIFEHSFAGKWMQMLKEAVPSIA